MAPTRPLLHSERHGRARELRDDDLATLVFKRIAALRHQGLFLGSFQNYRGLGGVAYRARIPDAEEFLIARLKTSGLGSYVTRYDHAPAIISKDVMIDLIELLHNEIVAEPIYVDPEHTFDIEDFDKALGQEKFRQHMNRVLELANPPLELLPIGHVVEKDAEHQDLYREPLPDNTERDIADPVKAAMGQFLRPGASIEDKRAAVKHLIDVLERIRPEVKVEMLSKDEADLFNIANNFALRHYGRNQKENYRKDVWLDWAFHVYLATVRAVLATLKLQETATEADNAA